MRAVSNKGEAAGSEAVLVSSKVSAAIPSVVGDSNGLFLK